MDVVMRGPGRPRVCGLRLRAEDPAECPGRAWVRQRAKLAEHLVLRCVQLLRAEGSERLGPRTHSVV